MFKYKNKFSSTELEYKLSSCIQNVQAHTHTHTKIYIKTLEHVYTISVNRCSWD